MRRCVLRALGPGNIYRKRLGVKGFSQRVRFIYRLRWHECRLDEALDAALAGVRA